MTWQTIICIARVLPVNVYTFQNSFGIYEWEGFSVQKIIQRMRIHTIKPGLSNQNKNRHNSYSKKNIDINYIEI